jgi:hypothetical protein
MHKVRRDLYKHSTLCHSLEDQRQLTVLEISQPTVNELRRA